MDREAGAAMTPDKSECYFIENEMAITTDGSVVLCVHVRQGRGISPWPVSPIGLSGRLGFTQERIDLISLVRSRGLRAYELCRETTGLPRIARASRLYADLQRRGEPPSLRLGRDGL